ncbi:hypothetical protein [Spirosoma validum]|uniref:Outer membrane protein beta-barrel domain-containing protein n=1 Tax=Spirosoma validum TaxID=2771355 RepID=A0A927B1N5_9BACT|nr:hypothetical protein [Spirosoma validum]MBD2753778.1 hypothetical protein [Spirosoma validum]
MNFKQRTAMVKKLMLFSLLFISRNLYAQYLKIDNGIAVSGFVNSQNLSLLKSRVSNYSVLVGSDYLEHKWYYLSSQIGYNSIGGKDQDVFIQNDKVIVTERRGYLHLNTTFRAYKRISGLSLLAGVGPYANVLLGSNRFDNELYSPYYDIKSFHVGGKGEIGVTQDINKFRIGLVGSYLMSLTPVAKTPYLSLNNNAFAISLTVGYLLH